MAELSAPSYSPLRDCAARDCDLTRDDGHLERISPTGPGQPFVGLCMWHYALSSVVLKPDAAALLDGELTRDA